MTYTPKGYPIGPVQEFALADLPLRRSYPGSKVWRGKSGRSYRDKTVLALEDQGRIRRAIELDPWGRTAVAVENAIPA